MTGFIHFIREQGVVGLAIGFILGGSVNKVVTSLVTDIINPLLGYVLGDVRGLAEMSVSSIKLGSFMTSVIDMLVIAAVIYFVFKGLKLDRLDMKKE